MKEERRSRRTPDHKKKSSMDVGIVCVEEEEKQEATQAGSSHRQPQGSERRSGPTGRKCVLYYQFSSCSSRKNKKKIKKQTVHIPPRSWDPRVEPIFKFQLYVSIKKTLNFLHFCQDNQAFCIWSIFSPDTVILSRVSISKSLNCQGAESP